MDKDFYLHSHYVCTEALQAIDTFTDDEQARYALKSVYLGFCRGRQGDSPEIGWGAQVIAKHFLDDRTPEMRRKTRGKTIKRLCQVRYDDETPLIMPMKEYNSRYGTDYKESYARGDKYAMMDYEEKTLFSLPHELYKWHKGDDGKGFSFITRVTEHAHRFAALDVLIGIFQWLDPVNSWGLNTRCMSVSPEHEYDDGAWRTYPDDAEIEINPQWAESVAGSLNRFNEGLHVLTEAGTVYTATIGYSDKPEYFCTASAQYWRDRLPLLRSILASNYDAPNELFAYGAEGGWQVTYNASLMKVLRPRIFPMTEDYKQMLDDIDNRTAQWMQDIELSGECY